MVCEGGLRALWLAGDLPDVFFLQPSPNIDEKGDGVKAVPSWHVNSL